MEETSRTNKSIKNSTVALCFYFISLILSFFSRKIFLDYLGTEILGLNTTASNLLEFLNLAELGISNAVGFSLYKPIHNKDYETINDIVSLQGHLYKRIAWMILGGAIILMFFFPLIFKKITIPLWYAYASFGVLLFSALLGYFLNYRQILLTASQKNYKVLISFRSVMIVKTFVQMWAVYKLPNGYIWWLIIEGIFAFVGAWSLHRTTIKEFPYLIKADSSFKNLREKYSEVVIKIKQVFFHKIGGFALKQGAPLIIYSFTSLTTVALYGNYLLIMTGINNMLSSAFDGMGAGVGHLVAEGNREKIYNVFCEIFSLRFIITSTLCLSVFILTPSFIKLWIGKEYLLPISTLCIIIVNLFINLNRYTVDSFISAYGLFADVWSPVIEALINIGFAIGLGYKFGLNGVLIGVLISQVLVICMWKPYYLITRRMNGFMKDYLIINIKHFMILILFLTICFYLYKPVSEYASYNYLNFLISGISIFSLFLIFMWGLLYLVCPATRNITFRLKRLRLKK